MTENKRLDGWKEIANYVNKGIATVQRWEKQGFPIQRVPGKQSVYAETEEIDKWFIEPQKIEESIKKKTYKKLKFILFSLFLLMVYLFISFYLSNEKHLYYEFETKGNISTVYVKEKLSDEIIWEYNSKGFDLRKGVSAISDIYNFNFITINDFDGNGFDDFVFITPAFKEKPSLIYLKTSEYSRYLCKISLKMFLEYEDTIFENFAPSLIKSIDLDGDGNMEWVFIYNSITNYPSFLFVFTHSGKEILKLTHPGRLYFMAINDRDDNGFQEIYVSGTNNFLDEFSSPIFLVLESQWDFFGKEYTLFDKNRQISKNSTNWLNICYINLKKDNLHPKVYDWERAVISNYPLSFGPNNLIYISASEYLHSETVDETGFQKEEYYNRWWIFDKFLKVADSGFNWTESKREGFDVNAPEAHDLLVPLYWNGEKWQEEVCFMPQKNSDDTK